MSLGGKKSSETTEQEVTKTETLDPLAQAGLDLLQTQAAGLAGAPVVAPLGAGTLEAIEGVGAGIGEIDPTALAALRAGASGAFQAGDRGALDRITDFIGGKAAREVSDVFTTGGRTGSPAQQKATAEAVAGAISPAVFGFEQNELARQDAANAQRITSALGLQSITTAAQGQQFQVQLAQLAAQGIIDEQTQQELLEPFTRLGLISQPILGAAGLGPSTVVQAGTGKTTGTEVGFELGIL